MQILVFDLLDSAGLTKKKRWPQSRISNPIYFSSPQVAQQSVWGREDEDAASNNKAGMNFATAAASNGPCSVAQDPPPPLAEPSLAPGYRGAMSSPVLCKMTAASPSLYHQPRPTSMYIEDTGPLYQQVIMKGRFFSMFKYSHKTWFKVNFVIRQLNEYLWLDSGIDSE